MQTWQVLADLKLDVAHLARYSVREGTVATRRMVDDVSEEEKMRRFRLLEDLQEQIVAEINARYQGQTVAVLFEEKVKGRWKGRTPTNKLVFVRIRGRFAWQGVACQGDLDRTLVHAGNVDSSAGAGFIVKTEDGDTA